MHIPTQDTVRQPIRPFAQALAEARLPHEDYDVSRWLYVPSMYCDYRYILGTAGQKPLICVGINVVTELLAGRFGLFINDKFFEKSAKESRLG